MNLLVSLFKTTNQLFAMQIILLKRRGYLCSCKLTSITRMKREESRKIKLCVLNKIRENKRMLFGPFSQTLSKCDKINCWKGINSFAISIGAIGQNRDWNYVRDVWWPNVRKSTMDKIDNAKKTGTGGGADKKITDVDDIVLLIIGKESAVVNGLAVKESLQESVIPGLADDDTTGGLCETNGADIVDRPTNNRPAEEAHFDISCELPATITTQQTLKRKFTHHEKEELLQEEAIKKRKLQNQLLEVEIYRSQLQARELEVKLGLPNSSFTSGIQSNMLILDSGHRVLNVDENKLVVDVEDPKLTP